MLSLKTIMAAAFALTIAALPAAGDEMPMSGSDIAAALTGNSVHGFWGDTEYYSYFDANGETIYTTKSGADKGTWRASDSQYCSVWAGSGEDCYTLLRDGEKIIWLVPGSDKRYDSTLIKGKAEAKFQ